ncbi:MAG: M81 family metallopeptidase [Alphaproteobacteria bacterium]|nr:M81 family metallopeptidase [Alphaproteobacteria bacterium]
MKQNPPRVLIAGLWHETNGFAPMATDIAAFRAYQWAEGAELLTRYRGTNTEIGGMVAGAEAAGLTLVPALFAGAIPSGLVTAEALEALIRRIEDTARAAGPLDGVLLALHGAMIADGVDEADAEVVRRVRHVVGHEVPIVASFDLHANLSDALVAAADQLIGYDTFPHIDMGARGEEAAVVLAAMIAGGRRPAKAFRKLPMITVPQMQATAEPPMAAIMARVFEAETRPGISTISVAQGFAYADVDHLGVAVVGYGEDAAAIEAAVDAIAEALWDAREGFRPALQPVEQAVERAVMAERGPVVLVEPADNVGGGAPGDGTAILAELIARGAGGAIVLWDPVAVTAAVEIGVGSTFNGKAGGRTLPALHGAPVRVSGAVVFVERAVSYTRDGPYMTGQTVPMGDVAVVETAAGLKVVLTGERVMPFDATHLRRVGIEPAEQPILVAKSGSAWKAAFGAMAAEVLVVDTGGVCSSTVERLPYTRDAVRAMWPLAG